MHLNLNIHFTLLYETRKNLDYFMQLNHLMIISNKSINSMLLHCKCYEMIMQLSILIHCNMSYFVLLLFISDNNFVYLLITIKKK